MRQEELQEACKVDQLFHQLEETLAKELLEQVTYPWEALKGIHDLILKLGPTLPEDIYEEREPQIWIAKSAKVYPDRKSVV